MRGAKPRIARVSVYADDQMKAMVAINDNGAYAAVSTRAVQATRKSRVSEDSDSGGMSLYQSLYETALKQGLPKALIDVLVRVFANDVDYQRATVPGNSIEAFFSEPDELDPRPELLYATMTVRDQSYKYYRFQTPDDSMVDFYDENGRSTRKFLLRKPIGEGEMTSPFGMRYHPILHFTRMHTGVDWAAPIGTPIYSAGNGVVIKAQWDFWLRAADRNPARQRLRDHLQSPYQLRPRHHRRRPRHTGPGGRLSRPIGIGHRAAPALRSDHQRQLRRPHGDQAGPFSANFRAIDCAASG